MVVFENSASRILIVDDARDIREPLGLYLRQNGFHTLLAESAAAARGLLDEHEIHLILLDIMMPEEDGLTLYISTLRKRRLPVIFLTALDSEESMVRGLDLGADDYISKPFSPRELLSRIRAVLRRSVGNGTVAGGELRRFADMTHDSERRMLILADGEKVKLTGGENSLLTALLDHPGKVLSREQLTHFIRGREAKAFERSVDNLIRRLRAKIGDSDRGQQVIVTEWGRGYRVSANVGIGPSTPALCGSSPPRR